ncbi:MAG: DNA mismatch repair endonuclease MutL [Gemmataceae bacterium]
MSRISQLPPSVVTKIAAGEVIERPASVVKEMLENSVDAGATRIDIEVEQGGIDRILIADNGSGIHHDDLSLVFSSHATSKLRNADDLFNIATLGFRGEAMASIGGVGQVTVQSRQHDQTSGSEITCRGGTLSPIKAWNGSPGTRIEVKHLFFNVPVRRKFLRKPTTEMGHIAETFVRVALSQPNLHMTLKHNGKLIHEVPATTDLPQRVGIFFGEELRETLYPVQASYNDVVLNGFIADPSVERGNAKMQYLFLNGRWIRDRSIGHAIQEAYRGLLMTGRYPVWFLFLEMPPDLVDVNVHPTKCEVRFRDGQMLYGMTLSSIRKRLSQENLTPKLQAPTSTMEQPTPQNSVPPKNIATLPPLPSSQQLVDHPAFSASHFAHGEPSVVPAEPVVPEPTSSATDDAPPLAFVVPEPPPVETDYSGGLPPSPPIASAPTMDGSAAAIPPSPEALASAFQNAAQTPAENQSYSQADFSPEQPDLKAIQLYNAYLVLETPEGMLVIDQHALHERILFEQLKNRMRDQTLETQQLLIPEPVDFPPDQAALALEHTEDLRELGLHIEDFGSGTLALHGYPAILGNKAPEKTLRAVVEHLTTQDRVPTREQLLNDLLSLMACHSAVRAGDPLNQEQIAALVAKRDLVDDTHHCPHGRPTSLLFTRRDLDRQFGRV